MPFIPCPSQNLSSHGKKAALVLEGSWSVSAARVIIFIPWI